MCAIALTSCLTPLALPAIAQSSAQDVIDDRLDEVLVDGSPDNDANPLTELPLGIGVSGRDLSQAPGSAGDPLRGLQSLPGLVYTDDESAEPAVRGSRPGDNLFQVDFLPAGYLFHAGGVISVFNSELVESFDIYPSAYGPEFSGVTGGVFDVRLRDPATDRLTTTIDASILQAGILVEGPINDTQSFYLAGRRSYLDLLVEDQLEEEDGIEFTEFPNYSDYQAKYVWRPNERHTLRAQFNGARDDISLLIDPDSEEIDNEPIFAGRSAENTRFDAQGLVLESTPRDGVHITSALSHQTGSSEFVAGNAGEADTRTDNWQLKSHVAWQANEQHELKAGAELTRIDATIRAAFNDPGCTEFEPDCPITDADRIETNENLGINAAHLFIKDSWFVSDRLTLYPGLALQSEDYLDKTFLEPRLALEYALRDDLIISAGLGVYHQIPAFDQINSEFGNPQLDYIESLHGVLGLEKSFRDGWDVKSEIYYKDLQNLVAGNDQTRYDNSGEGYAYGWDTLVRKSLTDRWTGWLSVSLSEARRRKGSSGPRFAFDYDQPINASLAASYQLSERWRVGAKWWVHSGAPYTPVIGAVESTETPGFFIPQYGELNSKRQPGYNRVDLRVDRIFQRRKGREMSAYVEALNVLNTDNLSEFDYNRDYTQREEVNQLPRILALGFRATF